MKPYVILFLYIKLHCKDILVTLYIKVPFIKGLKCVNK